MIKRVKMSVAIGFMAYICITGLNKCLGYNSFDREAVKEIVKVTVLPMREEVVVNLNVRGYSGNVGSLRGLVQMKPELVDPNKDSIILQEVVVEEFKGGISEVRMSVKGYPSAVYRLGIKIYDKERLVYSAEEKVPVGDRPEWLINPVGIKALDDDTVLPPFTPINLNGRTVNVWNRSYTIGLSGLPSEIMTQQASILKGPMTMRLISCGKNIFPLQKSNPVKVAKGLVEYFGEGKNESVEIRTTSRIEFDGFFLYAVEIIPRGLLEVENFSLEIPFKSKYAVYMFAGGEPTEPTIEGPKILDIGYSKVLAGEGLQWCSPFKESVWLGDDYRGLTWFCESEENWYPQEYAARRQALQIEKKGDTVQLKINFISAPIALNKPVKYTFGFMATPVRPKPAGWRGWQFTLSGGLWNIGLTKAYKGNLIVYWPHGTWDRFYESPIINDEDKYKQSILVDHAEGRTVLPYFAPTLIGIGIRSKDNQSEQDVKKSKQPDFKRVNKDETLYGPWIDNDPVLTSAVLDEWQSIPTEIAYEKRGEFEHVAYYVCPMSHWSDYAVWLMQKHARLGADGIGIFDGCSGPCSNTLHGCGYKNERGEVKPTYTGLGVRDMCKRLLYVFVQERGGDRKYITGLGLDHIHAMNSTRSVFTAPFFDAGLKGEELNSGYWITSPEYKKIMVDKYYYANILPLEKFRIEFGHQWGWVPVFFPQLGKSPGVTKEWAYSREGTKDFLVLTLLHDCLVWPYWCNAQEVFNTWKAKDKFGIADANVEFLPYYDNEGMVKSSQEDVKVSFYRKPGKIMLIIANLSKEAKNAKVELNLKKLGMDKWQNVFDAVTDEKFVLQNNVLSLSLPPRDYKMIILE